MLTNLVPSSQLQMVFYEYRGHNDYLKIYPITLDNVFSNLVSPYCNQFLLQCFYVMGPSFY